MSGSAPVGIPLDEILGAVAEARAKGWMVRDGIWLSRGTDVNESCCCPLGACVLQRTPTRSSIDTYTEAAEVLGISESWADGFADGFDGNAHTKPARGSDPDIYAVGRTAGTACREALATQASGT